MEERLIKLLSRKTEEEKRILEGNSIDKNIYTVGTEFVVNESKLQNDKEKISVRTHTRYTAFPEHTHSYIEMMIVLSGSITHRIKDKAITLGKGEILILNRHTAHSIDKAERRDIGVNVIMSDSFSESVASDLSLDVFSPFFSEHRKPHGAPMYLHFTTGGEKKLDNIIENLLFELTDKSPSDRIMTKTLSLLLTCLSENSSRLLLDGEIPNDKRNRRAVEITNYIKTSYRTATLTELSQRLYLSVPYLSKLIRELYQKSFKELLVNERMERASELLRSTKMSVSDIIQEVGYENESYFHREFKKRYGMTPLEVRKGRRN